MNKPLPILCLDFDGVIHSYSSGWQGAAKVSDAPVHGAMRFIEDAVDYFRVCIFSSRSCQPGGLEAMKTWLLFCIQEEFGEVPSWFVKIEFPCEKPAAMITLDDRAITFEGTWPGMGTLLEFKPWNKR